MTLTRPAHPSSTLLVAGLCGLLSTFGSALPAAARPTRAHAHHHQHLRRHIYIPRMLPTVIPAAREGYATVLRGRASWYGKYFQGMKTASDERYDRFQYTCAHKTLPFGTRLRVTNINNGETVVVRVSDRGPFRRERILDLSELAARPLGLIEAGSATVVAEVVPAATPLGRVATPAYLAALTSADPNPRARFTAYQLPQAALTAPLPAPAAPTLAPPDQVTSNLAAPGPRFVVQAGTFADLANARAVQARILALSPALPVEVITETINGQALNRVVVGELASWLAAEAVRRNLQLWGMAALVRQVAIEPVKVASLDHVAAPVTAGAPR